jgi:predicted DNA-binding ribbon-helix-helix protein
LRSKAKDISMKSPVVKRSIVINGHKTSVSLEETFWSSVKEIAAAGDKTLSELTSEIDSRRQQGDLSSAIRLFVLDHFFDCLPMSQNYSPSGPPRITPGQPSVVQASPGWQPRHILDFARYWRPRPAAWHREQRYRKRRRSRACDQRGRQKRQ